jgi:hypothetical protein
MNEWKYTTVFEHCDKFMSQSEMKIYSVINTFKLSVERGDNSYIVFHIFNPTGIALTAFFNLGISQSPFDLDDKEVAESMSCTTNYPLQFEGCRLLFFKI